MDYIGEHWFAGKIGHFFVVLSFVSALVAAVAYWYQTNNQNHGWRKIARWSFRIHSVSVLAIVITLFAMILGRYFEYDYVWKHSNLAMPMKYIFSCFWEGQEGSFLLWIFWHMVLGNILIFTAKNWEAPVMAVVSVVQVFLGSMLLGIYILDYKMGSSPFLLIRELNENAGLPWTQLPDYLERIPQFKDGRGLNPLLQNYWMTIHPPTLFVGFAATLIPFAYAIAGIWTRQYREWIEPALVWVFFAVASLGLGILMGGAWAYEALTFGGFWAWDPVENSSLVPWITIVGAAHVMLINRKKERSLFTAYFLTTISFILVLYSTFLTRSGVLGDTSVHSFTGDGMTEQLLVYLLFFVALTVGVSLKKEAFSYWASAFLLLVGGIYLDFAIPALVMFVLISVVMFFLAYKRYFPRLDKEEELWSREFWIFIASLVLLLSAAQITFETSKPVYNLIAIPFAGFLNWLFDLTNIEAFQILAQGKMAPKSDVIAHYNKWQVPFAFIVTMLISVGQYFSYKKTDMKVFVKRIALSFVLSILLTVAISLGMGFKSNEFALIALMFSSIFAIVANADYFIRILKGQWKLAGSSVAHVGFALLMLGALISTAKSVKISENTSGVDIHKLNEAFDNRNDILLFKGDTLSMNEFFVLYSSKEMVDGNSFYNIEYFAKQPRSYKKGESVFSSGFFFRAKDDHAAGESFLADREAHWDLIAADDSLAPSKITFWNAHKPAEKIFTLRPYLQINERFGNVPEPDTKHYLHKDIYTHIRWAELEARKTDVNGYFEPKENLVAVKDTFYSTVHMIVVDSLLPVTNREKYNLEANDIAARAVLRVINQGNEAVIAEPLFVLRDSSRVVANPIELVEQGLKFALPKINPQDGKLTIMLAEHEKNRKEFIVMQAIMFPWINVLWIGCILMVIGTILAVIQRIRLNRKNG
jgi:cytochrome c-type biogenesis protein CcmF